jgi:hypothetical protein
LLKATKLIRAAGLRERMPQEPEAFAKAMNRLCHRHDAYPPQVRLAQGAQSGCCEQFKPLLAHDRRTRPPAP